MAPPLLAVALLAACPAARPAPESPMAESAFDATLRVDPEPGAKRFQGVWLERDDGERWLVAYRAWGWLVPFDGQRVTVTGARYSPDPREQAVLADHYRLETLAVDPAAMTAWISVGPERILAGSFATRAGDAGTKSEGESWRVLVVDGVSHDVANPGEVTVADGVPAAVTARVLRPSPYHAGRQDPVVWVLSAEPALR